MDLYSFVGMFVKCFLRVKDTAAMHHSGGILRGQRWQLTHPVFPQFAETGNLSNATAAIQHKLREACHKLDIPLEKIPELLERLDANPFEEMLKQALSSKSPNSTSKP